MDGYPIKSKFLPLAVNGKKNKALHVIQRMNGEGKCCDNVRMESLL